MQHSHIFDVNHRNRLNSEERQRMLSPLATLNKLGYQEGRVFADIGCGTGLFTFPAADIGGKTAKIYAVDISPEMLNDVRQRADALKYDTIKTVLSDTYDFNLNAETADFILICAVLHEIEDKTRFISEAKRISAEGAKIAVIEFNDKELDSGPPLSHRLPRAYVRDLLTNAGFSDIEDIDIGEVYYAVSGTALSEDR